MNKTIVILILIIVVSPFFFLTFFFDSIPEQIPAFIDLNGNPILWMNKNLFSVFRIPLMGLALQIIFFIMYLLPLAVNRKNNEMLWLSVSLLAAIKMGATSLELLFTNDAENLHMLRMVVFISILIAVIILIFYFFQFYKLYRGKFISYYSIISTKHKMGISSALLFYCMLVALPFLL